MRRFRSLLLVLFPLALSPPLWRFSHLVAPAFALSRRAGLSLAPTRQLAVPPSQLRFRLFLAPTHAFPPLQTHSLTHIVYILLPTSLARLSLARPQTTTVLPSPASSTSSATAAAATARAALPAVCPALRAGRRRRRPGWAWAAREGEEEGRAGRCRAWARAARRCRRRRAWAGWAWARRPGWAWVWAAEEDREERAEERFPASGAARRCRRWVRGRGRARRRVWGSGRRFRRALGRRTTLGEVDRAEEGRRGGTATAEEVEEGTEVAAAGTESCKDLCDDALRLSRRLSAGSSRARERAKRLALQRLRSSRSGNEDRRALLVDPEQSPPPQEPVVVLILFLLVGHVLLSLALALAPSLAHSNPSLAPRRLPPAPPGPRERAHAHLREQAPEREREVRRAHDAEHGGPGARALGSSSSSLRSFARRFSRPSRLARSPAAALLDLLVGRPPRVAPDDAPAGAARAELRDAIPHGAHARVGPLEAAVPERVFAARARSRARACGRRGAAMARRAGEEGGDGGRAL